MNLINNGRIRTFSVGFHYNFRRISTESAIIITNPLYFRYNAYIQTMTGIYAKFYLWPLLSYLPSWH